MTRGKIIYIDKECKAYTTIEFNGDMYGRKYEPGIITDENGQDIDFRSAEKVYEYLTEEKTYN